MDGEQGYPAIFYVMLIVGVLGLMIVGGGAAAGGF